MALTEDELKAKKFGLPKVKKFPMPDAAHVRSAIKFFNYAKPSQERELANAILARMDEYGIDPDDINVGDDNRFKKYLDQSHLMHHGIKGMKWGVRRYETAGGRLTSEGKKRYAKYYKAVSDKVSNAATNAKKKAGDSAAKAKKAAANVAKGAAIVGGLAAAGYLGKIGMEEAASFRNNSLAKKAAESLMSDHFTDLDSESRAVVKDRLTAINREKLRNQDRAKSYNRKKLLSDAAKAYNPKSGSKEARDDLREKVRRGAYSSKNRSAIDDVVNKKNINMYEAGLRNAAQATVNPNAYNSRVRSERQKAESKYQEDLKRKKAESKERVDAAFQRIADAERKRR